MYCDEISFKPTPYNEKHLCIVARNLYQSINVVSVRRVSEQARYQNSALKILRFHQSYFLPQILSGRNYIE